MGEALNASRTITVDGGVELGRRDDFVHEADLLGLVALEAASGQKQFARGRRADLLQHVRRNHRRQDAELGFGEAEDRVLVRHDDVADGRQTGAAAERRAVDAANHDRRHGVDGQEHFRGRPGIAHVVVA